MIARWEARPLHPLCSVLHSHVRRYSCSAMVSAMVGGGLDDAIQTLSRFEGRELSGRFTTGFNAWPPLKHITNLERMQLSDTLKMVKLKGDFERRLDNIFVPGKLGRKAVSSGATGLSTLTGNDGTNCILVVLHSVLPRVETLNSLLPEGAAVAVKEPILAATLGGSTPVLVAPCHAALEFFHLGEELGEAEVETEVVLDKANRLFRDRQYILAAQQYSYLLSRSSLKKGDYVLAASGRATCFLKLRRFEDAFLDSEKALGVDPGHEKSLEIKAEALGGLGLHKEALKHSKNQVLSNRFSVLVKQAEQMTYKLEDYYVSGCKFREAPECSDYFGPVEARMTTDGRGRGLFLTADVVPGQILLVNNALAFVSNHDGRLSAGELQTSVEVEALRVCSSSSRVFNQIRALADAGRAPDMSVFMHKTIENSSFVPVEVSLVIQMLGRLSFGLVQSGVAPLYGGAWGLPSLINHSCLPNVAMDTVGRALFMRASRELRAGQELFLSYVEALEPWCIRSNAHNWQFNCKCQRCVLEKRHDRVLREILEPDPKQRPGESEDEWVRRLARKCVKLEGALERLGLTETEANWIRASASHEFVNCIEDLDKVGSIVGPKFPTALQMMKILHEAAPGQFMTSRMISRLIALDVNVETSNVCLEELSSRYGWELYLKPNLLASLVSWIKTSEALNSVLRVE